MSDFFLVSSLSRIYWCYFVRSIVSVLRTYVYCNFMYFVDFVFILRRVPHFCPILGGVMLHMCEHGPVTNPMSKIESKTRLFKLSLTTLLGVYEIINRGKNNDIINK